MIVVSDTSPITTLLQIGRVDLLEDLYEDVLIPEAVREELSHAHPSLPIFFKFRTVKNRPDVKRLLADIDPGEAEAIVLAQESHADLLLIDETEGRIVAAREGVRFMGLIGVLLKAKEAGYISSLRHLIGELETETTFHLSARMKTKALEIAGEL